MIRARIFDNRKEHISVPLNFSMCIDTIDKKGLTDFSKGAAYIHFDHISYNKAMKQFALSVRGQYIGGIPTKWLTRN